MTRKFPELLAQLRSLYSELIIKPQAQLYEYEFHLTLDDERALFDADPESVGAPLVQSILLHGARAALPQLYGIHIVWGADKTALKRKHQDPD